MINRSGAEFGIKELSAEIFQILNNEWPYMKDVVAGESVAFLNDDHFGTEEGRLDGDAETARPRADHQHPHVLACLLLLVLFLPRSLVQ